MAKFNRYHKAKKSYFRRRNRKRRLFRQEVKIFFAVKMAPQVRINTDVSATARCGIFPFHKPSYSGTGRPAVFYALKKQDFPNPANPYIDTRDIILRV